MEHGLSSNGYSPVPRMDNPLSTRVIAAASQSSPNNSDKNSPNRGTLHVGFSEEKGEVKEKRERFLTAKYGAHQMALIRKRLAVEMWIYEQLNDLHGCTDDSQSHDVDLDLDDLLDMEDDSERRTYLQKLLSNAKSPPEAVDTFVSELLNRTKVL